LSKQKQAGGERGAGEKESTLHSTVGCGGRGKAILLKKKGGLSKEITGLPWGINLKEISWENWNKQGRKPQTEVLRRQGGMLASKRLENRSSLESGI